MVYTNYFEYDLAGNRTHLHYVDTSVDDWTYYTYNIENQLTIEEKGGIATYYTYDPAGALLRKKVGETVSYYEYNYDGLMDRFDDGNTVATYKYDAASRRIEKTEGETTTKFEYNGADVVAEYDGSDTLQVTFNTPSIDHNLTQKRSGNIYHYLQDGLGSVRNLIDSDETIQNTYDYVAFGSIYGTPVETISNPFRFTSRRWDSESLLHYYRARMYDQRISRFYTKDKFFQQNIYSYVRNRPTLFIDPTGLKKEILDKWDVHCPGGVWSGLITTDEFGFIIGYAEGGGTLKCTDKTKVGIVNYKFCGQVCDCAEVYKKAYCKIRIECIVSGIFIGIGGDANYMWVKYHTTPATMEGRQQTQVTVGAYFGVGGSGDFDPASLEAAGKKDCSVDVGGGVGWGVNIAGKNCYIGLVECGYDDYCLSKYVDDEGREAEFIDDPSAKCEVPVSGGAH